MNTQDPKAIFKKAAIGLFRQPSFLVAFAVLLLAAVGLNAATQFMQLHFKKLSVPLAHSLDTIPMTFPTKFGSWVCVSKDQLTDDIQQELATDQYVMRYYLNTAVVEKSDVASFEGKDNHERMTILAKLRDKYRGRLDRAIINFAVTYYTGKADTVAHIPERCYTADGYEPTESITERWDLKDKQSPDGNLDVRYISFDDQAATAKIRRNVGYFFHVNGGYTSDPKRVRIALQNLWEKYGYYAKIELMIQDVDREKSAEAMQEFLTAALPDIEKCFPNWAALPNR